MVAQRDATRRIISSPTPARTKALSSCAEVPELPPPPRREGPPECVIFVGLPASGKTTFFRERFVSTHAHVSKDNWPNAANRNARQARLIAEALSSGRSVVVDNTNPALEDRRAIIDQARALGARVIGYHFDASTRDAVGRNRGRTGKPRVPDIGIFSIAKRLVPPRREEGFDELYRVSIGEGGRFDVRGDVQLPLGPSTPAGTD